MSDVECPYCGAEQEINHDDGYGYQDGVKHQQDCAECDKTFVFETFISLNYEVAKADCLNGATHRFEMTRTTPRAYARMRCVDCDEERKPTPAEFAAAGVSSETKGTPGIDES